MAEPVLGDRNLLHGVLAVQLNFVDAEQLTAAMGNPGGNVENPRPLLDILLEQQALDRESCELIEGLVKKHLQRHGGDSQRSLAALPATHRVREALSRAHGSASEATRSFFPLTDRAIELDLAAKRHAVSADGRYLIVRPHAKGGLGQVSLARDLQLDREVAYKELLEFHADDEDTRTRFELEANARVQPWVQSRGSAVLRDEVHSRRKSSLGDQSAARPERSFATVGSARIAPVAR
jgi:hypothetical protein